MKEAAYFEKSEKGNVRCRLCPHNCNIHPDKSGICGVRKNMDSVLYTEIYGQITSIALDPVEKKPLYHYYPGSRILSIGTKGCNLKCPFCQNWQISQNNSAETSYYSPLEITDTASKRDCIGIAYTYSEPVIWFEYVMDTAGIAREKGLKNVMVTNGYINRNPLKDLLGVIDAMNIDIKSFNPETYKKIMKAELNSVLESVSDVYKSGCHLEITTLIVTGINDNMDEMMQIADFIKSIDKNIPWHISRYYPCFDYDKQATDIDFILEVYQRASEKLNFVYSGNISSEYPGSNTICPSCGKTVIIRHGYSTVAESVRNGICLQCGSDLMIKGYSS